MNANFFQRIAELADAAAVDRYREPCLPPLDMSRDAMLGVAAALEPLARALGLDASVTVLDPLLVEPRSNAQIEMQLVNLQLGMMRAMLILGYDWNRMEAAMHRMLETGPVPEMRPLTLA